MAKGYVQPKPINLNCYECGAEFIAIRKNAMFCSKGCRQKYVRRQEQEDFKTCVAEEKKRRRPLLTLKLMRLPAEKFGRKVTEILQGNIKIVGVGR